MKTKQEVIHLYYRLYVLIYFSSLIMYEDKLCLPGKSFNDTRTLKE